MPICARRLSCVSPAMSRPSIRMRPSLRPVKAEQQMHQRRFAGAGTADQPDPLARRDVEIEVAQHAAAPRRAAVIEADILEADCPRSPPATRPRPAGRASAAPPRSSACRPAPGRYRRRCSRSAAPRSPGDVGDLPRHRDRCRDRADADMPGRPQPRSPARRCRPSTARSSPADTGPTTSPMRCCARQVSVCSSTASRTNSSSSRERANSLTVRILV